MYLNLTWEQDFIFNAIHNLVKLSPKEQQLSLLFLLLQNHLRKMAIGMEYIFIQEVKDLFLTIVSFCMLGKTTSDGTIMLDNTGYCPKKCVK